MIPAASAADDASSPSSSSLSTLLVCALIGLVWGFSNPFVRRGAIAIEEKKSQRARAAAAAASASRTTTPAAGTPARQKRAAAAAARSPPNNNPGGGGLLSDLSLLVTTPSFLAPQLLNQGGSVAFNALLASGKAPLSVASPVVNAVTLAANALADVLLGEAYRLPLLIPGVALVTVGLVICST
jgi:hypothetical protein